MHGSNEILEEKRREYRAEGNARRRLQAEEGEEGGKADVAGGPDVPRLEITLKVMESLVVFQIGPAGIVGKLVSLRTSTVA